MTTDLKRLRIELARLEQSQDIQAELAPFLVEADRRLAANPSPPRVCSCPLALALTERVGTGVTVTTHFAWIAVWGRESSAQLGPVVLGYRRWYDTQHYLATHGPIADEADT